MESLITSLFLLIFILAPTIVPLWLGFKSDAQKHHDRRFISLFSGSITALYTIFSWQSIFTRHDPWGMAAFALFDLPFVVTAFSLYLLAATTSIILLWRHGRDVLIAGAQPNMKVIIGFILFVICVWLGIKYHSYLMWREN